MGIAIGLLMQWSEDFAICGVSVLDHGGSFPSELLGRSGREVGSLR